MHDGPAALPLTSRPTEADLRLLHRPCNSYCLCSTPTPLSRTFYRPRRSNLIKTELSLQILGACPNQLELWERGQLIQTAMACRFPSGLWKAQTL